MVRAISDAPPPRFLRLPHELPRQLLLFCVVGLGNTAVDGAVYALLVAVLGWRGDVEVLAASALGFLAGAGHSFVLNARFTFGRRCQMALAGRYLAVLVGGLAISVAVSWLVLLAWPGPLRLLVAKILAMAATLAWNFSLSRCWVFRARSR